MIHAKAISVIAWIILGIIGYSLMGGLTYEYFYPGLVERGIEAPDSAATIHAIGWPITWLIWVSWYVSVNYTLAVFVSLFLLAMTWPAAGYGLRLSRARWHKKALIAERSKQQELHELELDEYLKKEGVKL